MNILILGNGFDLAHGLPTRYVDFLNFCQKYNSFNDYFEDDSLNQKFNCIRNNNLWILCFNKILQLKRNENYTWIDFENIIYDLLLIFTNTSNNTLSISYEYVNDLHTLPLSKLQCNSRQAILANILINKNWDYVTINTDANKKILIIQNVYNVCLKLYEELRNFIYLFNLYCMYIFKNTQLSKFTFNNNYFFSMLRQKKHFRTTKNWLINFNYTNTFDNYQKDRIIYSNNYIYPHGRFSYQITSVYPNKDNFLGNLVLGTRSFMRKENTNNIPIEFNIFQKHNQRNKYNTINEYQLFLRKLKSCQDAVNIYVIGHSLDSSDHSILKHLFNLNYNAEITIFFHDEQSQENYINNITSLLGEEDVALRVKFKYQHDSNYGILLPINT